MADAGCSGVLIGQNVIPMGHVGFSKFMQTSCRPGMSTQPEKIEEFFERLKREFLRDGESFRAVVEVCGFNDWLLEALNSISATRRS